MKMYMRQDIHDSDHHTARGGGCHLAVQAPPVLPPPQPTFHLAPSHSHNPTDTPPPCSTVGCTRLPLQHPLELTHNVLLVPFLLACLVRRNLHALTLGEALVAVCFAVRPAHLHHCGGAVAVTLVEARVHC
eukprot:GDKI01032499.1.p1 GENE.GDKI01032499.1~~GDKI01032499.1.p1  ORF type:complete len:131 (+),score=20.13 GDKI01032499.1:75-467(+)